MRKSYLPLLFYALLALLIMGPLLKPGYLLTLDITRILAGPVHYQLAAFGLSGTHCPELLHYLIAYVLNLFLPQWVTQKLFLFLALFLAGVGAHRLCPANKAGKYFAGMLYMVNPFIYTRLLAGQMGIVLSYSLLPFALYYFIAVLEGRGRKNVLLSAVFVTLVGVFSNHGLLLVLLAYLVVFVARLVQERRNRARMVGIVKRTVLLAVLFLLLNAYWLTSFQVPSALGEVTELDIFVFSPRPTTALGTGFSLLSMRGFWRTAYVHTTDILSAWWVVFIFIFLLAVFGATSRFNDRKLGAYVKGIGLLGLIGLFLSLGVTNQVSRPVFTFLWDHLPFFRGFRDSQKFVALLVLAYFYLGGLGCDQLAGLRPNMGKKLRAAGYAAIVVVLLLPVTNCFVMFNGLWGQVGPTFYPEEWEEANRYLNRDTRDFNVLFLPWHGWMPFEWLPNRDKNLATPAYHLFDKPMIVGDTIEAGGIYTESTNPMSRYIDFLLASSADITNLGELLAPLNVKYVLLAHEADYEEYGFLYEQEDLKVEREWGGMTLFRNEHPTARAYAVDTVTYIQSLEEYLELSRSQDVMEHLYILGSGSDETGGAGMQELDVLQRSPVEYRVEGSNDKYTVFTLQQLVTPDHWEYDGQLGVKNLGFAPAFESSLDGGTIRYARFYWAYLPGYIVSALTLLLALLSVFPWHRWRDARESQQR
jgi:hypothetical protein